MYVQAETLIALGEAHTKAESAYKKKEKELHEKLDAGLIDSSQAQAELNPYIEERQKRSWVLAGLATNPLRC